MVIYGVDTSMHGHWSASGGFDLIGCGFDSSYIVVGEEPVFHFVVAAVQQEV